MTTHNERVLITFLKQALSLFEEDLELDKSPNNPNHYEDAVEIQKRFIITEAAANKAIALIEKGEK